MLHFGTFILNLPQQQHTRSMQLSNLRECRLFKGISNQEIELLFENLSFQQRSYKKGDIIAFGGEEILGQMILTKGSVKGEMLEFNGKAIKIEDIEAPRMLAPAFLFGEQRYYPVNIVANINIEILYIPRSSFVLLMQKDDRVLQNYLNNISNRAQFLSEKLKFLSFQSIKGKLAHFYLMQYKKYNSDSFELKTSQTQMAELFGVARPSLARSIKELNDEGVIQTSGKIVMIKDLPKLQSYIKR